MSGINSISSQNQTISQNLLRERNFFNSLVQQSDSRQIDPPKGKLLPNYDPVTATMVNTVNVGKDVGRFVKAVTTGKCDDNSLGRMNDVGLKIGGAGIATYLATKRVTSTTKGMEWVGFAAFMAAMTLWPKIFINLPMSLKHGFHIDQKYQDSHGRQKPFFLDNQYLPWDLWSKEDLNKIGDKKHIDPDIKDREELIKKSMQKTALQGRTLATLTAGAGVPLSTAMFCNFVEPKLANFNINRAVNSATKNLQNAPDIIEKTLKGPLDKNTSKAIKAILGEYKTKPIDDSFYFKLGDLLNPLSVLRNEADGDSFRVIEGLDYNKYVEATAARLKSLCTVKAEPKNAERIAEHLISTFGKRLKVRNGMSVDAVTTTLPLEQLKDFLVKKGKDVDVQSVIDTLIENNVTVDGSDLKTVVESAFGIGTKPLDQVAQAVEKYARESRARMPLFEKFANALAGNRAESVFTRGYNDISSAFIGQMSPTSKQMRGFFQPAVKVKGTKTAEDFVMGRMQEIAKWEKGKNSGTTGHYFIKSIKGGLDKMDQFGRSGGEQMEVFKKALPHLNDPKAADALTNFIRISKADKKGSAMSLFLALDLERKAHAKGFTQEYGQNVIDTAREIVYKATTVSIADPALSSGGNSEVYKKALELLCGGAVDKDIKGAMGGSKSKLYRDFIKYREQMQTLVSSEKINTKEGAANLGEPIIDMFKKTCKQKYNSGKWMKIFGIAFAAVVGVTLLAQFFIGRTKKEEKLYKDKGVKNAQ